MQHSKQKLIGVLFFLLGVTLLNAQELKEKQLRTLSSLGVPYSNYDRSNENINKDFQNILKLDKKQKVQSIASNILIPMGLVAVGFGVSLLPRKTNESADYEDDIGGHERGPGLLTGLASVSLLAVGAAQVGVGIPLFVSSKSKKKRRDVLLSKYEQKNN